MFSGAKKPYSAITVQIDRLTSEQYEEGDLGGIVDLVEVIRIQSSGPQEAARAIRKKLKYGSTHRQLRALTILDGLIQNAGSRFQKAFADEPLLERLRLLARDDLVDAEVRSKCNALFRQWAHNYKNTPGLEKIASLSKQVPQTRRPQPHQSKVIRETEREAQLESPTSPEPDRWYERRPSQPTVGRRPSQPNTGASSSTMGPVSLSAAPLASTAIYKKDRKSKHKPFNLDKEKPLMLETLASAGVATTNLQNALKFVNRENQRVSENQEVINRFETCKLLRRQILRYIHLVESDQWIGSLLNANDELTKALMSYEIMDKSIDDDSDSETEEAIKASQNSTKDTANAFAGLTINEAPPAKPPRPTSMPMPPPAIASGKQKMVESESESEEEVDEDDPFGDQNAVKTPYMERGGMTWREV